MTVAQRQKPRPGAQGIVKGQAGVAAEAEDHFDAVRAQHFDCRLGAIEHSGASFHGLVHSGGYISAP